MEKKKEKAELSLMGQLRKEADRDFSKYLKYVNEIFEENKNLREENKKLIDENNKLKDQIRNDRSKETIFLMTGQRL